MEIVVVTALVLILTFLYVFSYKLNKKTKVPDGCQERVQKMKCDTCQMASLCHLKE